MTAWTARRAGSWLAGTSGAPGTPHSHPALHGTFPALPALQGPQWQRLRRCPRRHACAWHPPQPCCSLLALCPRDRSLLQALAQPDHHQACPARRRPFPQGSYFQRPSQHWLHQRGLFLCLAALPAGTVLGRYHNNSGFSDQPAYSVVTHCLTSQDRSSDINVHAQHHPLSLQPSTPRLSQAAIGDVFASGRPPTGH